MTDQNLMLKNIDQLEMQTFEQLQAQTVSAAVISLGSNHQAEQHLATVHESLAKLGEIKLSKAYQNPDVTATPTQLKPDYINQCVCLALKSSMTLQQLQQLFKQFEDDCNRQRQVEKMAIEQVTLDIDILLVKLKLDKNSLSNTDKNKWIILQERYPFKAHEMAGVEELMVKNSKIC